MRAPFCHKLWVNLGLGRRPTHPYVPSEVSHDAWRNNFRSRDLLPGGDDHGLLACPASCVLVEARRAARPPGPSHFPERAAPFAPIHKSFCKVNNCLRTCRLLVTSLRIFKVPSALDEPAQLVDSPTTPRLLVIVAGCPASCAGVRRAWSTPLVSRAPPVRHGQVLRRRRSASHRRPRGYRGWVALLVRVRASRGWLASRDPRPPPVPPETWARAPGRPGPARARDPPRGSERPETPRPAGGAARSRSRRGGGT